MTAASPYGRTQSTRLNSLDVVLCFALTLHYHPGSAPALRATARRMRNDSPYEHRPKLRRLLELSDRSVLDTCWRMVDQTWELSDGHDERPAPRCHMKPMRLAGSFWYCQHCSHIKERIMT